MTKEELLHVLKPFFKDNAHTFGVTVAFLYGSWVHGMQRDDSDVDVAVMLKEKNEDAIFDVINTITLRLCDVLHREVNVLYIDDDISKPMLHYNAIVQGEVIYFDDFTHYVDVYMSAMKQMEDFSIFGLAWQKYITEKNLKDLTNA